jgi:hypothetical protein
MPRRFLSVGINGGNADEGGQRDHYLADGSSGATGVMRASTVAVCPQLADCVAKVEKLRATKIGVDLGATRSNAVASRPRKSLVVCAVVSVDRS